MITFNILLGGFCVLLLFYYMWTRRRFYYISWKIGGPFGYPFLGMVHKFFDREKIIYSLLEMEKSYGGIFVSWLGPTPLVVISEPKLAQIILTSNDCVNKSVFYHSVIDWLGTGLITSKNPDWTNHRKLLNPTFNTKLLLSFFPIFNCEGNNLQDELKDLVGTGEMDLSYFLQKCTLQIAIQTTMGQTTNPEDQYKDLLDSCQCALKTTSKMASSPWLAYKTVLKMTDLYRPYIESKQKTHNFIKNQIKNRILQKEKELNHQSNLNTQEEFRTTKNFPIFIDRAIDLLNNGEFTWRDIEDESRHIVFGAFETTANTLRYVLIMLSMFPKYQDKLFEEVKTIIPSKDSKTDLTYEDLKKMTYMDMVLNENMRIMSPIPIVGRETTNDLVLPDGVVLPKGLQVFIDVFNMHRDPEFWGPDSTTFNPDQFLPENMAGKHPYAFIPFLKGLRNCIGWRYGLFALKIILSKLIRKYRFTTKFDFHDLKFIQDITIKLKKHPLLEIHLREL